MDHQLLKGLVSTANLTTKIKIVISDFSSVKVLDKKLLNPWPNKEEYSKLTEKNRKFISDLGIKYNEKNCRYRRIPHGDYESIKASAETLPIDDFAILKDYFEIQKCCKAFD